MGQIQGHLINTLSRGSADVVLPACPLLCLPWHVHCIQHSCSLHHHRLPMQALLRSTCCQPWRGRWMLASSTKARGCMALLCQLLKTMPSCSSRHEMLHPPLPTPLRPGAALFYFLRWLLQQHTDCLLLQHQCHDKLPAAFLQGFCCAVAHSLGIKCSLQRCSGGQQC